MSSTISKKQAAELWANLRASLLAVEDGVRQIIATRAWEPLGYETFAACWTAELGDLKLSRELRAVVVFGMFEDAATDADVARAVAGVGVSEVSALRDAHTRGMDAHDAAFVTRSRPRARAAADAPRSVVTKLQAAEYEALRDAADAEGTSLAEYVRACILQALGQAAR